MTYHKFALVYLSRKKAWLDLWRNCLVFETNVLLSYKVILKIISLSDKYLTSWFEMQQDPVSVSNGENN